MFSFFKTGIAKIDDSKIMLIMIKLKKFGLAYYYWF